MCITEEIDEDGTKRRETRNKMIRRLSRKYRNNYKENMKENDLIIINLHCVLWHRQVNSEGKNEIAFFRITLYSFLSLFCVRFALLHSLIYFLAVPEQKAGIYVYIQVAVGQWTWTWTKKKKIKKTTAQTRDALKGINFKNKHILMDTRFKRFIIYEAGGAKSRNGIPKGENAL